MLNLPAITAKLLAPGGVQETHVLPGLVQKQLRVTHLTTSVELESTRGGILFELYLQFRSPAHSRAAHSQNGHILRLLACERRRTMSWWNIMCACEKRCGVRHTHARLSSFG